MCNRLTRVSLSYLIKPIEDAPVYGIVTASLMRLGMRPPKSALPRVSTRVSFALILVSLMERHTLTLTISGRTGKSSCSHVNCE